VGDKMVLRVPLATPLHDGNGSAWASFIGGATGSYPGRSGTSNVALAIPRIYNAGAALDVILANVNASGYVDLSANAGAGIIQCGIFGRQDS
jgi:hypothetical protein